MHGIDARYGDQIGNSVAKQMYRFTPASAVVLFWTP